MRLIFTSDPLNPRRPDYSYQDEYEAAQRLGLECSLINLEALVDEGDAEKAVRRVTPSAEGGELAIYRGWMITPGHYTALHDALGNLGITSINTPEQYEHCHYLPRWYEVLEGHTPRSVWTNPGDASQAAISILLQNFGDSPVVVKDYVKSRKHEWHEACFIPSASDQESAIRIIDRFVELQGKDLNGGLVLREFMTFEPLGTHSRSGMPLTREFRLFYLGGQPIQVSNYWEEGDYQGEQPPLAQFTELASKVSSRFFTMDVARTVSGEWVVVELGDAQVSDLPEDVDPEAFFLGVKDSVI